MAYLYDLTDTWNAAGTVFNAIKMNVTNTASAAGSKIVSLQVGATDRFTVDKDGNGYFSGTLQAVGSISSPNAYISGNSGTIGMQDNTASILVYNATGSGGITNTLRFITGAAERVRIDASGNVGIGTSSPTAIWGTTVQVGNGTGNGTFSVVGSGGSGFMAMAGGNFQLVGRGSTPLQFGTNDTIRATIDTSGNLGIGTAAPSGKLNIVDQSNTIFYLDEYSDADGAIIRARRYRGTIAAPSAVQTGDTLTALRGFGYTSAGSMGSLSASIDFYAAENFTSTAQGAFISFRTNSAGSAGAAAERMRIDASGNLLLNTTTAVQPLTIGSGSATAAGINQRTTQTDFSIIPSNSAGGGVNIAYSWVSGGQGPLRFSTSSGEVMRLDAAGNLGIGTTAPSNQLSVGSSGTSTISLDWTGDNAAKAWFSANHSTGEVRHAAVTNYFPTFYSNNSERMRIDLSGNVGIGTSSPNAKLDVVGSITMGAALLTGTGVSTGDAQIELGGNRTGSGNAYIDWHSTAGADFESRIIRYAGTDGGLDIINTGTGGTVLSNSGAAPIVFQTNNTERARIDGSGNLMVGTTSANGTGWTVNPNGSGQIRSTGTGSQDKIQFANGNGVVGAITTNGTATAYNTSSDYRLKTVDGPITNSGAYIDALNPVQGSWKEGGSRFIGLIAHEVQEVSETQIATGVKDGEEMQAMDYSAPELIANLIAEIQSLRARVAQLEGK